MVPTSVVDKQIWKAKENSRSTATNAATETKSTSKNRRVFLSIVFSNVKRSKVTHFNHGDLNDTTNRIEDEGNAVPKIGRKGARECHGRCRGCRASNQHRARRENHAD